MKTAEQLVREMARRESDRLRLAQKYDAAADELEARGEHREAVQLLRDEADRWRK